MKVINVTEATIGGSVGNYGNKHVETPEQSFIGRRVYLNGEQVQFSSTIEDAYVVVQGTNLLVFTDSPFEIPDLPSDEMKVNAGEAKRELFDDLRRMRKAYGSGD